MTKKVDIVLINPGDRKQIYQNLANDFSAIEPPFWVAVLAAFLREQGFNPAVLDANALNITPEETAQRVKDIDPLLAMVVVYGSQPSASTQNMTVAGRICRAIRQAGIRIAIGGLHPSALPGQTMEAEDVDFVIEGEGFHTLNDLVGRLSKGKGNFEDIPGLWYREGDKIMANKKAEIVQNLDMVLPIAAWDLLPMEIYKAHNWHCFDDLAHRMPYGAIYTSLGCPYSCEFCCINAPFGKPGIRYRSPGRVLEEIGLLVERYGIKNLKIVDELFILNENHYLPIIDGIIAGGYDLNIWAYARVDTVKREHLAKMKKAGINWLALGIESANPDVRDGASKRMRVSDIGEVVRTIQAAGIRVIGNYIFGLPDDTLATMRQTLDLAKELNCEFANFYCAMAYPGSKLYETAIKEGWTLPESWHGFSQHSYEMQPLPSRYISAVDVLRFRDEAFHEYFENPLYLTMIEERFGLPVREHVEEMTKTRIRRKLLENGH
jgi:anaerobic magnesium-protoporphyrin IX monomethyl ester cyclase